MKPTQCIEITDWVSCAGGLPLGSGEQSPITDLDVDLLFECEMDPHEDSGQDIVTVRYTILNYVRDLSYPELEIICHQNIIIKGVADKNIIYIIKFIS